MDSPPRASAITPYGTRSKGAGSRISARRSLIPIAGDAKGRAALKKQIEARRDNLFADLGPVRALERCLCDAVAHNKSGRNRNRTSWD
jgi:hypothetical protein